MALHPNTVSLLNESISEYLQIAEYCITTKKDNGGVFGFPGAALLLIIVDTVGSYYRGDKTMKIKIDGNEKTITSTNNHFYILNSDYYGLNLSEREIKRVHKNYRNLLLHNSALAMEHFLSVENLAGPVFTEKNGKKAAQMNLIPFLAVTKKAVKKF